MNHWGLGFVPFYGCLRRVFPFFWPRKRLHLMYCSLQCFTANKCKSLIITGCQEGFPQFVRCCVADTSKVQDTVFREYSVITKRVRSYLFKGRGLLIVIARIFHKFDEGIP